MVSLFGSRFVQGTYPKKAMIRSKNPHIAFSPIPKGQTLVTFFVGEDSFDEPMMKEPSFLFLCNLGHHIFLHVNKFIGPLGHILGFECVGALGHICGILGSFKKYTLIYLHRSKFANINITYVYIVSYRNFHESRLASVKTSYRVENITTR